MRIKAILLMAGVGSRFGSDLPKQFHRLAGKKLYLHTLEAFLASKLFAEIILVCPKSWLKEVECDLQAYFSISLKVVEGGQTRQQSSLLGLLACGKDTDIVVIHDAVRPFVSQEILKLNVEEAIHHAAVDTCIPSADTLVYAPDGRQVVTIPNRSHLLRGQTPQSFSYPDILEAHLQAKQANIDNCSDDCSLIVRLNHPVQVVPGDEQNIKITSELDLFLAEQILRLKHSTALQENDLSSLIGKKIAITGGTGGIGREICQMLEQQGAFPIPISRSSGIYPADLTSFDSAKAVFDKILQEVGSLDGLINSIGTLTIKPFHELANQEIDSLIQTNLTSVIYSCRCAHLKPQAHLINIASSSYTRGRKNYALYASAKAALVNFTQGLAEERPDLFVNVVVPGRTLTPLRLKNFPKEDPSTLLSPAEVAREIILLLKQNSITASTIEVKKSQITSFRQELDANTHFRQELEANQELHEK